MVKDRIAALRREMQRRGIDMYIIPTSDFHESEYVGDYFKARKYMTGFTGSAGTAVVTLKEAGLWTDGRYFIQAQQQLENGPVTLFKMGEEGVPTVKEYVEQNLMEGQSLGFDGRVVNGKAGMEYEEIVKKKNGTMQVSEDLVDLIWENRPPLPQEPVRILPLEYTGESTLQKLSRLREKMKKNKATVHILTSLYDIAWLLNIRGGDIENVPVVLSFLLVTEDGCCWYVNQNVVDEELACYLKVNQIQVKDYNDIYEDAAALSEQETVLLSRSIVNFRICSSLDQKIRLIDKPNPTELMKAVKNPIELANTRKAHVKDGVAFTKFMYWVKQRVGKEPLNEISAADYLEKLRREQEHFLDLSFGTICAYGANAAMMHYSATEESNASLEPKGFLLVDSGGHYLEGTTDITRTIALGALTMEEKRHFTAVCRANLNLAAARFLHGCRGVNLDILARGPLWDVGLDYKCGTGHGVGHILNVHEGPNGFRWKIVPERSDSCILEEGMVTTDEPGVYLEGKYGIRTENELICRKGEKNEYGQFMYFENITCAPIDLDAILPEEMTETERRRLNDYHKMVYDALSPHLSQEEKEWLKEYTRAI
ncbi:MAG: aminopeptidase P family protein [Lachnospiraceae bacterium]|jgi:Xaa-Pro aminopeptidase|nr:aminopeptidase P family protein [Lachnospiraceae bacterium]